MWQTMTDEWPAYDDYQKQDRAADPGHRAGAGGVARGQQRDLRARLVAELLEAQRVDAVRLLAQDAGAAVDPRALGQLEVEQLVERSGRFVWTRMPPGPISSVLPRSSCPSCASRMHSNAISVRQLRRRSLAAPTADSMPRNALLRTRQRDRDLLPHDPFKAFIAPRPIGWVSTLGPDGELNLAPYSYFNAVCDRPPMLMFSSAGRRTRRRSPARGGEFVWNMATWDLREQMNETSRDAAARRERVRARRAGDGAVAAGRAAAGGGRAGRARVQGRAGVQLSDIDGEPARTSSSSARSSACTSTSATSSTAASTCAAAARSRAAATEASTPWSTSCSRCSARL